ncbi:MAG: hypothetical protein AAFY83_08495 [Pseudomonadota bacterium]
MNAWFLGAGIAAALVALIHLVLGGREIARPTLTLCEMPSVVRYTNYFCWHLVTLALTLMSTGFFYSVHPGHPPEPAAAALLFSCGSALLCFGVNFRFGLNHAHHPQWALFLPVAALGAIGFLP